MNKKSIFISVLCFSLIVAILSILLVILGLAKTPSGTVYMGVGHYYLDYYYYLQFIAQGLRGYWLPHQYSAIDDPSVYFHLEPYVLFGQLFRIFHLPPVIVYWLVIFLMAIILTGLIFLVIRTWLKDRSFYLQFSALIICVIAAPFFYINRSRSGIDLILYDYWASNATFFNRFSQIPHHLLGQILAISAIISFARFLKYVDKTSFNKTVIWSLFLTVIISYTLTFYPFLIVILVSSFILTFLFFSIKYWRDKDLKSWLKLMIFLGVIITGVGMTGLLIKYYYYQTMFFRDSKGIESVWSQKFPLKLFFLNLGPAAILSFFGLFKFFRKINPISIILLFFVISSFSLFYSPVNYWLNTNNARFLSTVNYIFIGTLAALGIDQISSFFKKFRKKVFILLFILFIFISIPPNIQALVNLMKDKNINTPITYLSKEIIAGFKFLDSLPGKEAVLTTPSQFLGTVLPVFTDRHAYVARPAATPNYVVKNITASNFYLGAMSQDQATGFLHKNGLKFVMLTSIEGYEMTTLLQYPFLKEIYRNRSIVIFKVK